MNELPVSEGVRWVRRLFPIAFIIVLFALLEGAARFAIWYKFGSAEHNIPEKMDYAPFVFTMDNKNIFNIPKKRVDVTRIMIIGSSTAKRILAEIWKEILEDGDSSKIEVINCAQGGYNSTQELVLFTLYGLQGQPDYVINLNGINDIVCMTMSGQPGIPYTNPTIERALKKPGVFYIEGLLGRSQLFNVLRILNERKREIAIQSDLRANSEMAHIYSSNINKMSMLCAAIGAQYIAILQPYINLRRYSPRSEKALSNNHLYRKEYLMREMENLRHEMKSIRIAPPAIFIDAIDVFDSAPDVQCFVDEAHLTQEGAKLLIQSIHDRIKMKLTKENE